MKKLILSAAFLAMGICTVSAGVVSAGAAVSIEVAQEKKPAPAKKVAQKQAQALSAELKLSPEQTARVEAAFLERINKQREIQQAKAGDKAAMKAEMKPVTEQLKAQLKAILTPEQLAQYTASEAAKAKGKKKKA
ncbi:MAG: hypothetical protein ACO1O1_08280 [Adhaeribacter sp.]